MIDPDLIQLDPREVQYLAPTIEDMHVVGITPPTPMEDTPAAPPF